MVDQASWYNQANDLAARTASQKGRGCVPGRGGGWPRFTWNNQDFRVSFCLAKLKYHLILKERKDE